MVALGDEFFLSHAAINMLTKQLEKILNAAKQVIVDTDAGTDDLKISLSICWRNDGTEHPP